MHLEEGIAGASAFSVQNRRVTAGRQRRQDSPPLRQLSFVLSRLPLASVQFSNWIGQRINARPRWRVKVL
jgi:hypothetical protein